MKKSAIILLVFIWVIGTIVALFFTSCTKAESIEPKVENNTISNTIWKTNISVLSFSSTNGTEVDTMNSSTKYTNIYYFDYSLNKDTIYINYNKLVSNNVESNYNYKYKYLYKISNDSLYFISVINGNIVFKGNKK